jgi:hypothetical protein
MSRHPVKLDVTQHSYNTPELKITVVFFHSFWPIHFMNTKISSVASIITAQGPHCLIHHMLLFSNIKFFGNTLNKISGHVFFWLVLLLYSHNEQSVHFFVACKADPSSTAKAYQNSLLIKQNLNIPPTITDASLQEQKSFLPPRITQRN